MRVSVRLCDVCVRREAYMPTAAIDDAVVTSLLRDPYCVTLFVARFVRVNGGATTMVWDV